MKKSILSLFIFFMCISGIFANPDSLKMKPNQVYVELLGANFSTSLVSLNYSRKFLAGKSTWIAFFGLGTPHKFKGYSNYPSFTSYVFNGGFLVRGKYKRNALWFASSLSVATGKWVYLGQVPHFSPVEYSFANYDYQFMPALVYQFQSRKEHFFCRLSLGPKFTASTFEHRDDSVYLYDTQSHLFWGGISIGGGW